MGVILAEGPHAREAGRHAGFLVAVQAAEIGQPQRQVAVRALLRSIDESGGRAVHRLDRELPLVDFGEIHILAIIVVVAAGLPERDIHDLRRDDLVVLVRTVEVADVLGEAVVDHRALGVKERRRGRLGMEAEQVELLAELAVVALLGLFKHVEVFVEFLLLLESRRRRCAGAAGSFRCRASRRRRSTSA